MNKLISIFMPTRSASADSLRTALASIRDTASNFSQVEILLRVDDDDSDRIAMLPGLEAVYGAKAVIGPRGVGYCDMGTFIDDLTKVATGQWAWLFDDDAYVEGNTWQQQLASIPCDGEHGPAVHAETYQLGPNKYPNDHQGGAVGLIVPMGLCRSIVHRNPVDQQWLDVIHQRGWCIQLLKDVTYCHDGRPR